ncbi:uncharacterized protein EV422DRAFT_534912 [Fimicolochytrium jonesii]|uniref:uncharacterized protein n=1 Tax=Fimicolochytrium jonesii TaxID=1396493 RepID=UPI0022FDF7C4|nr:uncharacterized protein EV422DRAFT_534912 [Fimicolochytrium jonesii]KAI8819484.1 hypothetical protein EV422DRAFT_534912 [Fimicolochytrium jonesii]
MYVEVLGNLDISVLSCSLPRDVNLKDRELYTRLSLDGSDWRNTHVCPPTSASPTERRPTLGRRGFSPPRLITHTLDTFPTTLPITQDTHHVYIEVWTLKREGDKEECIAKGKHSIKDAKVLEMEEAEVKVDLHWNLHMNRGYALLRMAFVKKQPGPPLVALPHGALPEPTSPLEKPKLADKFKETVRKLSKTDLDTVLRRASRTLPRAPDRLPSSSEQLSQSL